MQDSKTAVPDCLFICKYL